MCEAQGALSLHRSAQAQPQNWGTGLHPQRCSIETGGGPVCEAQGARGHMGLNPGACPSEEMGHETIAVLPHPAQGDGGPLIGCGGRPCPPERVQHRSHSAVRAWCRTAQQLTSEHECREVAWPGGLLLDSSRCAWQRPLALQAPQVWEGLDCNFWGLPVRSSSVGRLGGKHCQQAS